MSRLGSHALVPSPGQGAAIPSRRALLSIIVTLAVLVLGLTLASPGRADRQLIERGTELVTLAVYTDDNDRHVGHQAIIGRLRGGPDQLY